MTSPFRVRPALTAKVALAAGLTKSMSALAVVPVRSSGVPVPPPIGRATVASPSTVGGEMDALGALGRRERRGDDLPGVGQGRGGRGRGRATRGGQEGHRGQRQQGVLGSAGSCGSSGRSDGAGRPWDARTQGRGDARDLSNARREPAATWRVARAAVPWAPTAAAQEAARTDRPGPRCHRPIPPRGCRSRTRWQ